MRMINRWRFGVLALAFCAPTSASALDPECGDVAAIINQAYPGAVAQGERAVRVGDRMITLPSASSIDPHGVVCRRWRGQPGLRLVAVPLIAQVRSDGTSGDLEVLVVNETTGTPHQRLRLRHAMDDGAIHLSGISFDTAAYRLGPDRLAFGVRREWTASARANPFLETTLSLYEMRDGALSPALEDLVVFRREQERALPCAGETVVTERILRMIPGPNGQDISVLERVTRSPPAAPESEKCGTTDRAETPRTISLRFDGERYVVPRPLKRDGR